MASPQFTALLEKQRLTMIKQFVTDPKNCWIGTRSLNDIDNIRGRSGGQRKPLLGYGDDEAFVWVDGEGEPECWVKAEDKAAGSGIYTKAWMNFCLDPCKVTCTTGDLDGFNVDHLYPETVGATGAIAYVRAMPVLAGPNKSMGTVEKAMKKKIVVNIGEASGSGNQFSDRERRATLFTLAKVIGVNFPAAQLEAAKEKLDSGKETDAAKNLYNIVFQQLCAQLTSVAGVEVSEQLSPLDVSELLDSAIAKARWMQRMPAAS